MKVGDEKEIDIPCAEAYGERRDELLRTIPKTDLGEEIAKSVTPGMTLGIQAPNGQVFPATVTDVQEKEITLDANHPLAGKDLHFKISIVATREATEEDKAKFAPQHNCSSCASGTCEDEGCGDHCDC